MLRIFRLLQRARLFQFTQHDYVTLKNQTYYEILDIPKDATKQDIRAAFIKLSKETHPDMSQEGEKKSHNDFVKINEAYNVLSKDNLRYQYDIDLQHRNTHRRPFDESTRDYEAYSFRGYAHSQNPSDGDGYYRCERPADEFYGVKGLKKMQNITIVLICIIISALGAGIQFMAILSSPIFDRDKVKKLNEKYIEDYRLIRASARDMRHDDAVRLLQRRYNRENGIPNVDNR